MYKIQNIQNFKTIFSTQNFAQLPHTSVNEPTSEKRIYKLSLRF